MDEQKILEDRSLYEEAGDVAQQRWVFSGGNNPETGCAKTLYLLDIGVTPPRVLSFGVEGACTEFHWASWGKKRSVIAIKSNVKFVYENGKLTPPPKDLALITKIDPPRIGSGIDEKKLQPFVREVSPPK
ncbi:hypothetical protein [Viridibacterium curvum]|uniref:Uncharacterized protein n=1 Tax=Viridibacterium curvum TaxID=1101404 RepID=A0ABP9R8H1_9RHOO